MKILIFSDNVAPYRIAWANEMGKTNDVTFVYAKDKDSERNDSWLVKKSDCCKMVKLPAFVFRNRAITLNVIKYIRANPADIIVFDGYGIIQNAAAMLYMNACKKRYFVNVDGIHMGAAESKIKRAIKMLLFSNYTYFLCGSQYTKNWLISMGIVEDHIIVHNFSSIHEDEIIETPVCKKEKEERKLLLGLKSTPTILAVGRFLDWKQYDLLVKAFIPFDEKAQLLIIGEGEEEQKYKEIIAVNKLQNVRIIGFMDYASLKKYYLASDLFVLPSYGEVWGLVVNEAMCHGLPVITSDLCIAGEALIVDGINGYKFKNRDVLDLSSKIGAILFDDELRRNMALNNLVKIHEYTIEHMARTHLSVFERWRETWNS